MWSIYNVNNIYRLKGGKDTFALAHYGVLKHSAECEKLGKNLFKSVDNRKIMW